MWGAAGSVFIQPGQVPKTRGRAYLQGGSPLFPLPNTLSCRIPVRAGGLAGFVQGLKRGILGFVVIPLASLLEMSARMADSIRRAVAGTSSLAWVRPPR